MVGARGFVSTAAFNAAAAVAGRDWRLQPGHGMSGMVRTKCVWQRCHVLCIWLQGAICLFVCARCVVRVMVACVFLATY